MKPLKHAVLSGAPVTSGLTLGVFFLARAAFGASVGGMAIASALAVVAGTGAGTLWLWASWRGFRAGVREIARAVEGGTVPPAGKWPEELAPLGDAAAAAFASATREREGLAAALHRTLSVIRGMTEGVVAVSPSMDVLTANAAAARLLELPEALFAPGASLRDAVGRHPLTGFLERLLTDGVARSAELEGPNVGGRTLQVLGAPLRDETGGITGAVAVINDITRLRRLERVRRDFVANVSHELRTPITSIKGFVETLLDSGLEDTGQAERFLRIVARQADRLDAILNDLLTLSRLEEGDARTVIEMVPTPMRQPVENALQVLESRAAARQVRLEVEGDPDLPVVGSAALLEQAVVNLVDNAIKHSDPGGVVRISVTGEEDGRVVLRVRDEGCGIPPEHLPRLFERFYRVDKARSRSEGGTGLGLAIVKHVALVHQGRVGVSSAPGAGSEFWMELPGAVRSEGRAKPDAIAPGPETAA